MGWKVINWNPFGEEPKKPEDEPPAPSLGQGVAPISQDFTTSGDEYSPFQAFGQTAETPEVALRKPVERPRGAAAFADPQQYIEFGKAVPGGAVSFVGTGMQGLGAVPSNAQANVQKNAKARIDMLDMLDRGEKPQKKFGAPLSSLASDFGYEALSPEQRRAERQKLQGQFDQYRPTPLAEQPLYQAGESVKNYAKTILPAAPGYEDAIGRQLGDGFGSLVAGLPFGIAGRIPGTIFFGAAGSGEAATRAIAFDQKERAAGRPGLTQDQINTSALYGIAPGTTDLLPVEVLLGRLRVPAAFTKPLAAVIGRIGGQAVIEGVQEGGQAALQNLIAREMYNPEQTIADGVAGEAGIGGGVGAIAQTAREAGGLALSGLSGRRAGTAAPGAPSSDPFAEPLMRQPDAAGSFSPSTMDVDFTDLIPPERRITQEPASPAGMEPPPSAPLALPRGQQLSPRADTASPEVFPDARDPSAPGTTPVLPVEQRDVYGTTQDSVRSVTESAPMAAPEMQPQRGDFSTGDIMAALGAPQAPAPERDNLGFYSKALESAKALKQERGTPEQMLAQLRTAGVKENEIKATGLDRFLASKTQPGQNVLPKVSKQEIVDFLGKNRVGLQESVYGPLQNKLNRQSEYAIPEVVRAAERSGETPDDLVLTLENDGDAYRAIMQRFPDLREEEDWAEIVAQDVFGGTSRPAGAAKWTQYSLDPSNPTYRENVISLAEKKSAKEAFEQAERDLNQKYWQSHRQHWTARATPEERRMMDQLELAARAEEFDTNQNAYRSGHWSERNAIAHTRTQILNDTKGRKVFNIDELQSDWGQALRENGVRDEEKIARAKERMVEANDAYDGLSQQAFDLWEDHKQELDPVLGPTQPWGTDYGLSPEAAGTARYQGRQVVEGVTETPVQAGPFTGKIDYWPQTFDWKGDPQGERYEVNMANFLQNAGYESLDAAKAGIRKTLNTFPITRRLDMLTARLLNTGNKELAKEGYELSQKLAAARQEANLLVAEYNTLNQVNTPQHPLVNTTDQWVTTAMRRLIQQAVDSGADGISITPSQVQNERFSLSQVISEIIVDPPRRPDTLRNVVLRQGFSVVGQVGVDKDGIIRQQSGLTDSMGKSLSELIGQRGSAMVMAADIAGTKLKVEDIEIGGEGMKATYDGIYPRTLGKLLQKLDPSIKPEKTRLFPSDYTPRAGSDHSLYYEYAKGTPFENEFIFFPLTEKAKQKIEDEGQPLFALGAGNGRNKRARDGKGRSESGSLAPLKGAPTVAGATGPDPKIVAAAEQYAKSIGIDLKRQAVFAEVNEELAGRIAQAYEEMAHNPRDPQVAAAYADMIQQTIAQYRALEDAGYQFFFYDEATDPYQGNPWNSIRDLRTNQRMGVFATEAGFGSGVTDLNTDDSPMLADTGIQWPYGSMQGPKKRVLANDLFRAVHDAFGHSMEGAGFRARGEENAWQAHIRLYTGPAVGAVTSETRGQNSWLNFGPYGEANRTASVEDTVFADQKIGLMPEFTWQEGRAPDEQDDLFALKGFYSPAIRATEKLKQEKATPDQWWSMITKSPGIRMEELQWMGLKNWLDEQAKPEYGPEERHLYINGDKLSEVFPNVHERITVRSALDSANYNVPMALETIRNKIEAGGYGTLADNARSAAEHLSRLSNAEFEHRNTAPLIREARKTIPKADLLHFMAQHEMDLDDKILGGKDPNARSSDGDIDWDQYEDEINERADEIYRELRQDRDDEALSEWERENDPDNFSIHVVPNVGVKREQYWNDVIMRDYRSAVSFFNDWKEIQPALPGIGHAVAGPKLSDFIPEDFWGEDGEPDFIYTLVNSRGVDIESKYSFDTYEEALAAAEAHLEKKREDYDDDRESALSDIYEDDYHDLEGEARRQARDEIEERVQNERADEDVDEDEAADPDDTGQGITAYGGPTQFKKYSIPGGEDYRELLVRFPDLYGKYTSAHYGDQELVHLRFDTRYRSGGGEKTMFIHEIQSDLHQRSREFGFGPEGLEAAQKARHTNGWTEESDAEMKALDDQYLRLGEQEKQLRAKASDLSINGALTRELADQVNAIDAQIATLKDEAASNYDRQEKLRKKAEARMRAAERYISTFRNSPGGAAPAAPYTGNAWWELAFKRAVQYAVENNFDAISLTNPKQINKASYTPMHVAKQFYGESLPRFINKYLKQWGVKQEKASLSEADSVEYVAPDNITLDQAIDYFRAAARHYRKMPNMTYFSERMESIVNALEITKPQTTEAILQIAEADGPGRTVLRGGVPGVEPLFRKEGANLFWRITDEMRKQVKESGQPLALGPGAPSSDVALKRQISAFVKMGRSVTVPYADAVHEVIAPHLDSVPDDVFVAVLAKVAPIKNKKGRVTATFKTNSGAEYEMDGDLSDITNRRAFFRPGGLTGDGGIFLLRFNAPGSGDKLLIGEVRHESIHALRESGALSGPLWSRLLDHAKNLRVLDSDFKTYLQMIGSPNAKDAVDGVSILEMYEDAYDGYVSYDESIDQEYVAHLAELYSHGALLPQEVAPVKELLDDIFAGKYSKVSGESRGESDSLQAFAGPWAKTANQNKLIQAQKLEAVNTGPFDIWKRTGWYKAADGRWKFEIDDSGAKMAPVLLKRLVETPAKQSVKLGKLLDHPELYKAYPEIRDVLVVTDPSMPQGGAAFVGNNIAAVVGQNYVPSLPSEFFILGTNPVVPGDVNVAELRSAMLHEVQHWIQEREGFARGANHMAESDDFAERARSGAYTEHDKQVMEQPIALDIGAKMSFLADQLAKTENPSADLLDAAQFYKRRYIDVVGFLLYERVAGEVEAREVQERADLTPEERRGTWPAPTPAASQVVRPRQSPYADDMLALGGKRAIGAPKEAMARAEAMEGRGRSPEAIWQATGTMRGIEGKQRWEIDDSGAKIIGLDKAFETPKKTGFMARLLGRAPKPTPGIKEANNVPLLNVLHHPKLYNAYPFLRQMRVNLAYGDQAFKEGALRRKMGRFTGKSGNSANVRIYKPIEASGSTPQELLEVLMHEIQHYIQDREGFARGSDVAQKVPTQFGENSNALYDPGQDLSEEERNDWRNLARNPTLLKMTRPESIAFQLIDAFERLDQNSDNRHEREWIAELGKRLEESMLVKGEDYFSSYGEAEANAVESRLGMTPQQRRANFPGAALPENLRDTSSQTRNYDRAYEEVMRRAQVFKDIKARWAERKDLGSGVSVVRPDEEHLVYTHGQQDGLLEAKTYESGADVSLWPEFLEKPYAEQKKVMDVAMRDLRSRNMRPEVAHSNEITDDEFAFWARYDPRLVAFEPRLYRDKIEELAKAKYGDDATVVFEDTGEVRVTSRQVRIDNQQAHIDREKAEMAYEKLDQQLGKLYETAEKKYGSDYRMKMTMEEKNKEKQIRDKLMELENEMDADAAGEEESSSYLDLTPIFGDRAGYRRAPKGMDNDMWLETMIDEQLAAMGKLPQPGADIDFSDLIKRQ